MTTLREQVDASTKEAARMGLRPSRIYGFDGWFSEQERNLIAVQSRLVVNAANDRFVVRRGAWFGVAL